VTVAFQQAILFRISALFFFINRIGYVFLWSGIGFFCLLVVHDFSGYIDRYPYLAVDDSLVNVAYALAKEGRYGFLASPLQAPGDWLRHQGFFNYGPWYFSFGALLIWLFGYSLALIRSIHLLTLIAIIVLGYFWFKRNGNSLPAAIAALGILSIFQSAHWPMVRPDVFVSLFVVLFVIAAGNAFHSQRSSSWFWVGLCAACAALTHLIAWTMAPVALIAWLRSESRLWCEQGYRLRASAAGIRFIFLVMGGLLGALMFYASFDFRMREHWATLIAYRAFVEANANSAHGLALYFEILGKHISSATGFLSPQTRSLAKPLVLGILAFGWGLWLCLLRWSPAQVCRIGEGLLFPPLLAVSAYLLSLGIYPNFHSGYSILTQVMLCWTAAAIIGVGLTWANIYYGKRIAAACSGTILILGLMVVVGSIRSQLQTESYQASTGLQWVPISDFMRELYAEIPKRGTAWGSVVFGSENPTAVQLIQFKEAVRLMAAVPPAERKRLAPDYIFWGYPENTGSIISVVNTANKHSGAGGSRSEQLVQINDLLPGVNYQLAKLVYAKPYGATRIYQKVLALDPSVSSMPQVAMFRPGQDYWLRPDWRALGVLFKPIAPVRLGIGYDGTPPLVTARSTLKASIPSGDYVFRVSLTRASDVKAQPGFLAITNQTESREQITELGPKGDIAPHLSDESVVYIVHTHSGGDAYLSYFEGNGFDISHVEVFPLRGSDGPIRAREEDYKKLADFADWTPSTGVKVIKDGKRYKLHGNSTRWGYQLVSPPIEVTRKSLVAMSLNYEVASGNVCAGILDEKENWLVAADRSDHAYQFNSAGNSSVRVVFANCNQQADGNKTSTVLLNDAAYRVVSSRLYTDDLVSEFKTIRGDRR
jgi:hypothetical protein